ncbi:MAG: DHH family phosphoesterase [Paludibacteraceae bacterium]|nr:DHH family phosphoesterase [Paludibacteraceae bacterium]
MTPKLDQSNISKAEQFLTSANRIVIFTHMAPDGDAMGSSLAMFLWIQKRINEHSLKTQNVHVITPNAFPAFLAWMPAAEQILIYENNAEKADAVIAEADLHICLDFNEPKRIGVVGDKLLQNPCPKILIDHHLNPADFATVTFSHPELSSTCELTYRFFNHLDTKIDLNIATCLYTGLMTDTGNFAFNSNNPDIYEMIAELVRIGIDKDAIYNAVFNQYSADRVRLMGYALYKKMQLFPEFHLALITLSDKELQQFNYKIGDTEGLVNMPLQISDVYYSVFMREQPPKPGTLHPVIKLSFRSQGDRPVNIFANEIFGGGGHKNASGGDFYGSLGQAVRRFLKAMPKYLLKE